MQSRSTDICLAVLLGIFYCASCLCHTRIKHHSEKKAKKKENASSNMYILENVVKCGHSNTLEWKFCLLCACIYFIVNKIRILLCF